MDGFTIDDSLVPPPSGLPAGVTIHKVESYTSNFVTSGQPTYDVIRICNLAANVQNNDPGSVVKNAMAMLKPGGYIEWDELDTARYSLVKTDLTHPASQLQTLLRHIHHHSDMLSPCGWIDSLPDILGRYGLQVEGRQHRYRLPFAYAKIENGKSFKEFVDLSYRLADKDEGMELRQLMATAKEECDRMGHMVTADLVIVVGRKVY
ncbi:MAG: hypothetical protein Q9192_003656 [Flavoplaca navasiana]